MHRALTCPVLIRVPSLTVEWSGRSTRPDRNGYGVLAVPLSRFPGHPPLSARTCSSYGPAVMARTGLMEAIAPPIPTL